VGNDTQLVVPDLQTCCNTAVLYGCCSMCRQRTANRCRAVVGLVCCTVLCRMGGNAQGLPKRTAALLGPDSDTSSSGADANPSVRFGNAVAASAEEFGERFGHYGRHVPACSRFSSVSAACCAGPPMAQWSLAYQNIARGHQSDSCTGVPRFSVWVYCRQRHQSPDPGLPQYGRGISTISDVELKRGDCLA
jgi:hypothetical protein